MALTNKSNFKIGNTEYSPKSIKTSYDSLQSSDTGRTDDGVLHITWVRTKITKLEIEMPPMTPAEATALLTAVQGQEYSITYWDISTNTERTLSVYTSNSAGDCYSGIVKSGLWQGISFNAIEK